MTERPEVLFDNRYRLDEEIGQGGMAVVHRAFDLRLGRPVAVKMLRPQFASDAAFLVRFRREAQAVANLSHPNLAQVWDTGEANGAPYIVMEYVDGENLKARIVAEGPFSLDRAVGLMIQICEGVGAAHRAGIIHRDLKPQNILVTRAGQVKVTDFGIARSLAVTGGQTQTGQVWGTAQYIAPEQASGQSVTPATDVYSLGVTMYEMLANRLPFEAETPLALAMQHVNAEPPPLRTINPLVPMGLEGIVAKAMAKRPSARYPDADAFCSALKAYQRLGEQLTGPIPVVPRATVSRPTVKPATASAPAARATRPSDAGGFSPTGRRPSYTPPAGARPGAPATAPTDWITMSLGILALVMLLGLIPLYWAVIQRFSGG